MTKIEHATGSYPPSPVEIETIEWLSKNGPDEWHGCIQAWNWDMGDSVPAWIASQPDCDAASALIIYWLSNGDAHFDHPHIVSSENPDDYDEGFLLARYVARRFENNGYPRRELYYEDDRVKLGYELYLRQLQKFDDVTRLPFQAPEPFEPPAGAREVDVEYFAAAHGVPLELAVKNHPQMRSMYVDMYEKAFRRQEEQRKQLGRASVKKLG
ncbi:MAG: DUF4274 domain-containing protein [Pseudomonadota bacterium]